MHPAGRQASKSYAKLGPPTNWGELVKVHDDRDVIQASPYELLVINIHLL